MKRSLCLMAAGWLLLTACGDEVTNPSSSLPAPRFVASIPDTAVFEQGIDAIPEEDAIFLQWYHEEALAGFQLFRRMGEKESFSMIAALTAQDSSYYDRVGTNVRCYYYLRGVDDEGRLSAPSDTTDYMLLAKATDLMVSGGDSLFFSWSIGLIRPQAYVLRLQEESSGMMIWISRMEPGFQGTRESILYNYDDRAQWPRLQNGINYRWRLDCVGAAPRTGSESSWQRFSLN